MPHFSLSPELCLSLDAASRVQSCNQAAYCKGNPQFPFSHVPGARPHLFPRVLRTSGRLMGRKARKAAPRTRFDALTSPSASPHVYTLRSLIIRLQPVLPFPSLPIFCLPTLSPPTRGCARKLAVSLFSIVVVLEVGGEQGDPAGNSVSVSIRVVGAGEAKLREGDDMSADARAKAGKMTASRPSRGAAWGSPVGCPVVVLWLSRGLSRGYPAVVA